MSRNPKYHKIFFIILKEIYDYMPLRFRREIDNKDFYRYIQDQRKYLGAEYTSIKFSELDENEWGIFIGLFMSFVYANLLGYYYDIENLEIITRNLESKLKLLNE